MNTHERWPCSQWTTGRSSGLLGLDRVRSASSISDQLKALAPLAGIPDAAAPKPAFILRTRRRSPPSAGPPGPPHHPSPFVFITIYLIYIFEDTRLGLLVYKLPEQMTIVFLKKDEKKSIECIIGIDDYHLKVKKD